MAPRIVRYLSKKNRVNLNLSQIFEDSEPLKFADFQDFLETYDMLGRVVRTTDDLRLLSYEYLKRVAQEGTIYVEFMHSPTHSMENGIELESQLDAIQAGIKAARDECGIIATVIATAVRHAGPDAALELSESLVSLQHPVVSGFGLTGNELAFTAQDFAGPFYLARRAGLGCTAHVGEWGSADSVIEAVRTLELDRVGHGINVVSDPAIVDVMARLEVGFEICLTSNHLLKGIGPAIHPVRELFQRGCKVTLATDDPGYFATTPNKEYRLAEREAKFDIKEIEAMSLNAIDVAFCSSEDKDLLRNMMPAT
jgi:adenosine deaminase